MDQARDLAGHLLVQAKRARRVPQPRRDAPDRDQGHIAGWADHTRYVERIRNYRAKPIDVEIRRPFGGHTFFISRLDPTLHDYQTPQMTAICPTGEKTELAYHIRTLQGYLAKQQNVTLEAGD